MQDVCACGGLKVKKTGTHEVGGVEVCNNCNRPLEYGAAASLHLQVDPAMVSALAEMPGHRVIQSFGVVTEMSTAGTWSAATKGAAALDEAMIGIRTAAARAGGNAILGLRGVPFGVGRTGPATSDAVGVLLMGDAVLVEPIVGDAS